MQLISIGQIIDQTWDHYQKNWRELISVAAWLLLPAIIGVVASTLYPNATTLLAANNLSAVESSAVVVWFINNSILAPIIGLLVFLMTVKMIHSQMEKRRVDFVSLTKSGWKLFLPVVLVNLLVFLVLAAFWLLVIPGILFYAIGALTNLSLIDGLGTIFMVAGVIAATILTAEWLVYLIYSSMALVLENIHGKLALKRSKELIHGRFWPVLIRFIVPKLVFFLVLVAAEWLVGYIIGVVISSISGFNADLAAKLTYICITLSITIGTILVNPLITISDYLLFDSLRSTSKK